jgi:glucosyl-3-phosphoglycerate synthase
MPSPPQLTKIQPIKTFGRQRTSPRQLARALDGRRLSVCLPARDEADTIEVIVKALVRELQERHPLADEVIVIDDGSGDATAARSRAAGARVVRSPGRGKGAAMHEGLRSSTGDLVAFCDADLRDFDPGFVLGLAAPLLHDDDIGFVKAFYDRPYEGRRGQGGRVTELVAKPLLRTLFPSLSSIRQPLSGECAGRREVLSEVPFVAGYGVDIALLIDVAQRVGPADVAQVDLGRRVHRNRPLEELAPQAEEVLRAVLARAGLGDPVPEVPPLADPTPAGRT